MKISYVYYAYVMYIIMKDFAVKRLLNRIPIYVTIEGICLNTEVKVFDELNLQQKHRICNLLYYYIENRKGSR